MEKRKLDFADDNPFASSGDEPLIDGCNYFTGEADGSRSGQTGINIDDVDDWSLIWKNLGIPAPGDLPEGASAHLFVDASRADCHSKTALTAVTQTGSDTRLAWTITHTPIAEGESRRVSYAVVLLPAREKQSSTYTYVDAAEEAAKKVAENIRRQQEQHALAQARSQKLKTAATRPRF